MIGNERSSVIKKKARGNKLSKEEEVKLLSFGHKKRLQNGIAEELYLYFKVSRNFLRFGLS